MTAYTKAQRLRAKRAKSGPKPKEGVMRTESGQISRSEESKEMMSKMELQAATWKRRQVHPDLSPQEARGQEHGSVIHHLAKIDIRDRREGKTPGVTFTSTHLDTAERYAEVCKAYSTAIEARRMRSGSDLNPMRGRACDNPSDARYRAAEQAYREMRGALLDIASTTPLAIMALETIILENKYVPSIFGDMRSGLNRLAKLWRIGEQREAA